MLRWEAEYANGHVVRDGEGLQYADLNRDGLTKLRVYDGLKLIGEVSASEGKMPFYRTRIFNLNKPNTFTLCLLGWKSKSEVSFTLIYPDGKQEVYSEWNTTPYTEEPKWFNLETP